MMEFTKTFTFFSGFNTQLFAVSHNKTLLLFSVRRTDRSNAKFATFSLGKTDNARRSWAADILPPSRLELSWSHDTAATDTSRLTLSAVNGLAGLYIAES